MTLPAHLSTLIELRIEQYLTGPADDTRASARTHRALPVYADVDGTLFLTPTGEVLMKRGQDANAPLVPEQSAHARVVALIAAAERFPELAEIIPARPASATTCQDCEGEGKVLNGMIRCGNCSGLGWLA
jgi:hypothetical protein